MTACRSLFRLSILGDDASLDAGSPLSGKSVELFQAGTTTQITQVCFAAATGSTALTNPLSTNAKGEAICWLDKPEEIDASVSGAGITAFTVKTSATPPGQFYREWEVDARLFGVKADGTTDDTVALQSLLDTLGAAGGGVVKIRGVVKITARIFLRHANLYLQGLGPVDNGFARSILKVAPPAVAGVIPMPAIVIGGSAVNLTGAGSMCGLRDLVIQIDGNPGEVPPTADTTYEGGAIGAVVLIDRSGLVSGSGSAVAVCNGRVRIENVSFEGCRDAIQLGTANTPNAAGTVFVQNCSFNVVRHFVRVRGCGVLFVRHNEGGSGAGNTDGGALVLLDGNGSSQPDSLIVESNFVEDMNYGVRISHSLGSTGNARIADNTFDGARIGVFIDTLATVNGLRVTGNTMNGDGAINNTYGVLVNPTSPNGRVGDLEVKYNTIQRFGRNAIVTIAPVGTTPWITRFSADDNQINDCGSFSAGNDAGIDVGLYTTPAYVRRNTFNSDGSANKLRHGVRIATLTDPVELAKHEFVVANNVANEPSVQFVSIVDKGMAALAGTRDYLNNVGTQVAGDASPGVLIPIGPFHITNPGASLGATPMPMPGTDSNTLVVAPIAGRVALITLSCPGAAIAAAANRTATVTALINGVAGALSVAFTPDGALRGASAGQLGGDVFARGAALGLQITTGAGWTAGDDVTAFMWMTPT